MTSVEVETFCGDTISVRCDLSNKIVTICATDDSLNEFAIVALTAADMLKLLPILLRATKAIS